MYRFVIPPSIPSPNECGFLVSSTDCAELRFGIPNQCLVDRCFVDEEVDFVSAELDDWGGQEYVVPKLLAVIAVASLVLRWRIAFGTARK